MCFPGYCSQDSCLSAVYRYIVAKSSFHCERQDKLYVTVTMVPWHQSGHGLPNVSRATKHLDAFYPGTFRFRTYCAHESPSPPFFRVHLNFAYELGVIGKSCMSDMHIE